MNLKIFQNIYNYKVYNDYGSSEARKFTGRPRITTKTEDFAMVKLVKKDRFKTAAVVSREMSIQLGKPLSREDCVSSFSWTTTFS